ncbi:MAG: ROK family protein, partial [Bdellovibrionales bacterium]|nr:ROK family protein [Bdellovibrionales bacterium]
GANFARRWAVKWEDSHLTGERLVEGARSGEKKYREVFHEYSLFFAYMVNALVVLYSPEKIFISGGFSEASDLFLPEAQRQLVELLSSRRKGIDLLPEISTARLGLATGLIGGAFIALRAQRVI